MPVQEFLTFCRLLSVQRSFVVVEVVCLELVEVEGRAAEGSRDAEEGSGARVRRSRCGPETPLVGRSVRHSPLPTPSINNFPFPLIRAEIAPETPSVVSSGQHVPARSTSSPTTPEELGAEVAGGGLDGAQGSHHFLFFWVLCKCVCVAPVCQVDLHKCK